ncbi:MAG: glycerol acyltransferase [Flavobacteriales bacterium]|nr:glycerol acyltransferase [Flavobacteriales bacterium]
MSFSLLIFGIYSNFEIVSEKKFIDIKGLIASKNPKLLRYLPSFVIRYLKRILHEDDINEFLEVNKDKYDQDFCKAAIDYFNIKIVIKNKELIPQEGPIIIAMNHPLGGMDAVALVAGLADYRRDLRFIVNDLLMNLKNISGLFIGVNKHGKNDDSVRNQIQRTFESEHAICIFPAGLVSRKLNGVVQDLTWKKTFMLYGRSLDRTIVPIHIEGELSNFFYRLSRIRSTVGIKANIEMLYLANELFKQYNRTITFTVGTPIKGSSFDKSMSDQDAAESLRKTVHELKYKV